MTDSANYSVVLSGNLVSGFETEQVVTAFARLFNLPPEKASRIIGTEFVIKREVKLPIAKTYKEKLANIGIEVVLQRHGDIEELELEPIEAPPTAAGGDGRAEPLSSGEIICPKCELRQPQAQECSGCGVIFSKIPPPAEFTVIQEAEVSRPAETRSAEDSAAVAEDSTETGSRKWLIAALAVVVLGALLWYAGARLLA